MPNQSAEKDIEISHSYVEAVERHLQKCEENYSIVGKLIPLFCGGSHTFLSREYEKELATWDVMTRWGQEICNGELLLG